MNVLELAIWQPVADTAGSSRHVEKRMGGAGSFWGILGGGMALWGQERTFWLQARVRSTLRGRST